MKEERTSSTWSCFRSFSSSTLCTASDRILLYRAPEHRKDHFQTVERTDVIISKRKGKWITGFSTTTDWASDTVMSEPVPGSPAWNISDRRRIRLLTISPKEPKCHRSFDGALVSGIAGQDTSCLITYPQPTCELFGEVQECNAHLSTSCLKFGVRILPIPHPPYRWQFAPAHWKKPPSSGICIPDLGSDQPYELTRHLGCEDFM